jgi:hypothetical protein
MVEHNEIHEEKTLPNDAKFKYMWINMGKLAQKLTAAATQAPCKHSSKNVHILSNWGGLQVSMFI